MLAGHRVMDVNRKRRMASGASQDIALPDLA